MGAVSCVAGVVYYSGFSVQHSEGDMGSDDILRLRWQAKRLIDEADDPNLLKGLIQVLKSQPQQRQIKLREATE